MQIFYIDFSELGSDLVVKGVKFRRLLRGIFLPRVIVARDTCAWLELGR